MKYLLSGIIALIPVAFLMAQDKFSEDIRLNQIGFYPEAAKLAVVAADQFTEFYVASPDLKERFYSGRLSEVKESSYSPKKTRIADFSGLTKPGQYVVVVNGLG